MWFRSAFDFLKPDWRSRRRRPPSLRLELLEDRTVPSFLPPLDYAVGQAPRAVATGDFRNDGIQDLVTCNALDNTVSVLLGKGDGSFQPSGTFPAGTAPDALAVGDFTGSGNLDVVTANAGNSSTPGSVSALVGNGNGTFRAPINFTLPGQFPPGYTGSAPLPQTPSSLAVGDMNHDGRLDVVVAAHTTFSVPGPNGSTSTVNNGYVDVLLGNGDGTFTLGSTTLLDIRQPQSVVLADFNGDGKLDVAAVSPPDNGGCVLLGKGDGTLGAPSFFGTDNGPCALVAGDINGDGKTDLATADAGQEGLSINQYDVYLGSVSVLLGNGDGTFQPEVITPLPLIDVPGPPGCAFSPPLNVPQAPAAILMGDLTGDGKIDLAVPASYSYSGYAVPTGGVAYTYGYHVSGAGGMLNVLLGNGDGTFAATELMSLNHSSPTAIAAGNFNNDTFPDLAVTDAGANSVSVLMNGADWSPTPQPTSFTLNGFPSTTTAGFWGLVNVVALNANGTTDTSFTGTVHFTSSDGRAELPADYTFAASDAGVHTFTAALWTAGTQSLTVTDGSITGSETGITVIPAAANKIIVSGFPSPTTAGGAGNLTVTLEDGYGNVASGYRGTLHFTSSDGKAILPANYTFTPTDAGVHTFSATLKTAGTQSITATDTMTSFLAGTEAGITVTPAAASKFILTAPASVKAGASFSLTLTVEDAYGNIVTNYAGTVYFSSSDTRATLPANYTFKTSDKGVHTFTSLVLRTRGNQKIKVVDTHNSALTVSVTVDVL
jgi:hypothetical protein